MYAKDVSGVTTPMWLDSAGTETSLLGGGSSGASTSLNNLTTTSVNQSLLPSSTNSKSLGSASLQWQNLFIDGIARIDSLGFGASYSMTLPTTLGTNGQVLTTNGSSALSWTTVSGSGGFPSPVNTNLDMNDNDILGVNLLDFDGTSTEIRGLTNLNFYHTDRQITSTGSYAGLLHTVASSEKHGFLIGGSTKMELSSDLEISVAIDMNNNKITNLDEPTVNDDAATKYYVDQNSGGGSSGANTSLSNLSSPTLNTNINANSKNINTLSYIRFNPSGISTSGVEGQMWYDGSNFKASTSTGSSFIIGSGGSSWNGNATSDLDMNGNDIDDAGTVQIDTLSSAAGAIYMNKQLSMSSSAYINFNSSSSNGTGTQKSKLHQLVKDISLLKLVTQLKSGLLQLNNLNIIIYY